MESTKARQVRVYLRDQELKMLEELVEIAGMRDTAVLSILCSAALRAAKEVDYRIPLALKFQILEGLPEKKILPPRARR